MINFSQKKNQYNNNNTEPQAHPQSEEIEQYENPILQAANAVHNNSNENISLPENDFLVNTYLEDDDEEEKILAGVDDNSEFHRYDHNARTIEQQMEDNIKHLKNRYTMGGIKSSRFITTDILLNAPQDYFDKYNQIVKEVVMNVQSAIADRGLSAKIGNSKDNPTDEGMQDDAYRIVHSIAADYMDKKNYSSLERAIIINLSCNEIIGFDRLDPLWRDKRVDEIVCNGPYDIQVEIDGQIMKVPSCKFRDVEHLMSLIERLYGAINKIVSRTTPLMKGRLHDNSRMFVVHPSVAPNGPNFNIRRHKGIYKGPEYILANGTANEEILTDLGNWIYKGASWIVVGGTSTGKTSLLAALSAFIPPKERVITIEDNLELILHPKKYFAAPMECQPAKIERPEDTGVTMRDLVKASLQMRPSGLIIGEVTDGSAYDLTQALNTGHWGCSTVHANSEQAAITRLRSLVSQGGVMVNDAALPLISDAFDFMIQLNRFEEDGSRKIISISEVAPAPTRNEHNELVLETNPIWQFQTNSISEDGKILGEWVKVNEISEARQRKLRLNIGRELSWDELSEIAKV